MFDRNIENTVRKRLTQFPAVALLGVRQAGKTSLAKQIGKGWHYFDLENPDHYQRIARDPVHFFQTYSENVILDEAQAYPQIFEILRGVIDQDRHTKGRFILTGSSSPNLNKHISESLAGRIATLQVTPLKANEICQWPLTSLYTLFSDKLSKDFFSRWRTKKYLMRESIGLSWLKGGFPEPLLSGDPDFYRAWMENYQQTYVHRDLRQLFPGIHEVVYQRFLSLLANLSGTIINRSEVGRALGVSEKTVRDYLEIAEGTFLWKSLPSYEKTSIQSVVKMPKGYLRDTGLLHYFLKIDTMSALEGHPIIGKSFESFVIEEILKGIDACGIPNVKAYYYRTRRGVEIDLILEGFFGVLPIEIKHGVMTDSRQLSHLEAFVAEQGLPFGVVVNQADEVCWLTKNIIQIPIGFW